MNDVITAAIEAGIPGARVEAQLEGNRAVITVVSEVFADMSRVRKQQAVYACIQHLIADGTLHAVSIRALTPDQ